MSFFRAENLTAGYGGENILDNISFQLERGCIAGVIGPNGHGKTTLLKAVCGIIPHKGNCSLDGEELGRLSPRQLAKCCSYIPQRSGITIDISVLDVVLMGFNPYLKLLEYPSDAMKEAARDMLRRTGLEGKEEMNFLHLSEGQKQLCILARTLVSPGKLLLLDEPESALDFRLRHKMLEILRKWSAETDCSALVSLHDPALALNYCDKLFLLEGGKLIGSIEPARDPLEKMEQLLTRVYGSVSLHRCVKKDGKSCIVMLKEDEP